MHGFLDGLFSITLTYAAIIFLLLFVALKLIGVLICSWWWVILPIGLVILFLILSTQPGAW